MCRFWDYHSGNRFQNEQTIVQPGSLESEAGINCISFDVSGSRLITGEVDKTIKCEPPPSAQGQFCDPLREELPLRCQANPHLQEKLVFRRMVVAHVILQT
jgi:pleiotropic regulator 1